MAPVKVARQRFLTEAARLFAERGYAATAIADIQLAAGVTAGSGALYKHFPSKQALLAAVVDHHIATMEGGRRLFADAVPDDLETALRFLVEAMWAAMRRDHDWLRVLLRDLDDFPELRDRLWTALQVNVYGEFTAWLIARNTNGDIHVEDPEATAAVVLASLTYYPILDVLIGYTPADIPADRFANAWVTATLAALTTPSR